MDLARPFLFVLFLSGLISSNSGSTPEQSQMICVSRSGALARDDNGYNCTSFASNLTSAFRDVSDGTIIRLFNKREVLESTLKIEHITGLTILGGGNEEEIVCNQQSVGLQLGDGMGLHFVNVSHFTLRSVTIRNCGALYNVSNQGAVSSYFATAVYIENSTDIEIDNILISKSIGTGLTVLDCSGNVSIHHSSFIDNTELHIKQEPSTLMILGGGGVYLEYTECSPQWQNCDPNSNLYNSHNLVHLYNCSFINNSVIADLNMQYTKYNSGGVTVWLSGTSHNNSVIVNNSSFIGNRGIYGGGLCLLYNGSASNNSMTIQNVLILDNIGVLGGGGMDVGFYPSSMPHLNRFNNISVINCNVTRNRAYFGGGISFFSTLVSQGDPNNHVEFRDTLWTLNEATYGSAIYVEPVINDIPANSFFPIPVFVNCKFIRNYITFNVSGNSSGVSISSVGAGAMNAKAISVILSGTIIFDGNNGTAVYIVDCYLIVLENTTIIFSNNSGSYGGAMSINGFASMYINTNVTFRFLHNFALVRGGAIYFFSTDIQTSILTGSLCFIERTRTRDRFLTSFYFENNTDSFGTSMYISSLLPCNKLCQGTSVYLTYIPPDRLLTDECIGNFTFIDHNGTVHDNVATETSGFDYDGTISEADALPVVPGKDFVIPFVTHDELGHLSQEPLFAVLTTNSSLRLQNIYTANRQFQIRGSPNDVGHLDVGTLQFRNLSVGINIRLSECPPGFINRNNTCLCSADYEGDHYDGIIRCDNQEFQASISSGLWVGYSGTQASEDTLLTAACPLGFCNDSHNLELLNVKLPSEPSVSMLDSLICGGRNRTGILCGQCIENNSVYFNSPDYRCGSNDQCSYGAIYYLLSSIVPLTVLFTLILLFGVNFSSGTWNGFVFYAQIVGYFTGTENGVDYYSSSERVLRVISVLFYGPFSLKFFADDTFSFCLFKNANFFAIMGMECLSLLFTFILVILLVLLMKSDFFYKLQFACCKSLIFKPTSLTKGLITFLILCYTQLTQICFKILHVGYLRGKGGSIVSPIRVFQMGSQPYFTGLHIPFAIGALIGIITVVTFTPVCLILYPVFYKFLPQKVQDNRLVAAVLIKIDKQKPIFDAFQGCYKDNYRFFSGLYFLYRSILVGVFALVNIHLASFSIAQVILMILLALHLWIQPYKKSVHNGIDGGLFLLLGVINTLTLTRYFESISQSQSGTLIFTGYLQLFFVCLPVVVVLVILTVLVVRKCYLKCSIKKNSLVGNDGEVSYEVTFERHTAATSYMIIDELKAINDDDDDIRDELKVLEPIQ